MRALILIAPLTVAAVLLTGCVSKTSDSATQATPSAATALSPSAEPATSPVTAASSKPPAAPSWPTPEDCVTYNPASVSVSFAGGLYTVTDGSVVVMRVSGQTGDDVGDIALALAKHYAKHCYLGRTNNREEKNSFIFDYWRAPVSGAAPITNVEESCSPYDRHNLTVEDMGDGNGWRVKDHDHVLGLFDNQTDARNGKLVLGKYSTMCSIGYGDPDPEVVTFA
jgi:hypothetical protein